MRGRHRIAATCFALALSGTVEARAQGSVADRIGRMRDGVVRMQYESRAGVCGDGKSGVSYRNAIFTRDFIGFGRMSAARCVAGPVRVSLVMAAGRITQVQTQIGGAWPMLGSPVDDIGVIPAPEASGWLFAHIGEMEGLNSRDRLLLPAALADADIVAPLVVVARDNKRTLRTRRQAVQWLGLLGDANVVPTLVSFTTGGPDFIGDGRDGESLAGSATSALATVNDGAGIPALMQLARNGSVSVRKNAVFWLAQSGDPRGLRLLHTVIEDTQEDTRVRKHAIFSLGNSDEVPASEQGYLHSMFGRFEDDGLKEAVLQANANDHSDGGVWLLARVKDTKESVKVRKSALFWAGQRDATSTSDLVAAYHGMDERALQEHAIFVISQRDDDAAINALVKIARDDPDAGMRGKALFWLAQKHDPRATKLIADLVLK